MTNLGEAILEAFNLTSQKPTKLLNNNELPLQLKNWIKDILIVESVIEVANKFQEEKSNLFNHSSINQTASYSCNSIKFSNFDDKFSFGPFNNVINDSNEELLLLGRVKRKIYIAGVTHSIIQ